MASSRLGRSYALRHHRKVAIREPVRFLVLGIIRRAVLDAVGLDNTPDRHVASARAFLVGEDFREFCGWLGVRPSLAAATLEEIDAVGDSVFH